MSQHCGYLFSRCAQRPEKANTERHSSHYEECRYVVGCGVRGRVREKRYPQSSAKEMSQTEELVIVAVYIRRATSLARFLPFRSCWTVLDRVGPVLDLLR